MRVSWIVATLTLVASMAIAAPRSTVYVDATGGARIDAVSVLERSGTVVVVNDPRDAEWILSFGGQPTTVQRSQTAEPVTIRQSVTSTSGPQQVTGSRVITLREAPQPATTVIGRATAWVTHDGTTELLYEGLESPFVASQAAARLVKRLR